MRLRRLQAALALGVALASAAAAGVALDLAEDEASARRSELVQRVGSTLRQEILQAQTSLLGVRGLFAAGGPVGQRRFARFSAPLLGSSGLLGLIWVEPVPAGRRAAFERSHGLVVKTIAPGARPRLERAGASAVHHPLVHMAPLFGGARPLLGLDLAVVPGALAALERARDSGEAVAAPLFGGVPSASSLLLVTAVYRGGTPPSTPQARRAALVGYAGGVYRVPDLARHALAGLPTGLRLQVLDGERVLFGSGEPPAGAAESAIDVGGRAWQLRVAVAVTPSIALPATILGSGLLLAALVALLFGESNRRERELRRVDDERRRQAAITTTVLDAAPYGIRLADLEGGVLLENPAGERILEALGLAAGVGDRQAAAALAERVADPDAFRAAMAAMFEDPTAEVRHEFQLTGTERAFQLDSAPVRVGTDQGEIAARIHLFREVTDERRMERAKDEFIALASHELRTPLTSILGYVEILRDGMAGDLTEDQERFLGVVDRNARRLLRLVNDLLAVARADAGRLGLEIGEVDLAAVACEAVQVAAPAAAERGIALHADVCGDAMAVEGDRARLGQVVDNLVSNAVKFTPPGGRIAVRLRAEAGEAVLEVEDTGPGIPRAEQDRLFQRFFRTSAAIASATPGTGLGLAISKMIVEAHRGAIEVQSEEGAGAVFRVRVPLAAAVPLAAPA